MLLARWRRSRRAELRADFARYYGLDLRELGRSLPCEYAADLAAMLPPGSRTMTAESPDLAWDTHALLLAGLLNSLRDLTWSLGGCKGRRPEHVGPRAKHAREDAELMEAGDYMEELERRRHAVN